MACLANGESLRFWQAANTIVVNLRSEVQQGYGNGPNGINKLLANHRKKIRVEWTNSMYNAYSKGDRVTHGALHHWIVWPKRNS
jgi:hypothetical protein